MMMTRIPRFGFGGSARLALDVAVGGVFGGAAAAAPVTANAETARTKAGTILGR
jgi:hypothetical protein